MKKTNESKVVKVHKQSGTKATKVKSSIKAGRPFECEIPPQPKCP
jgi:hypothetical protein